MQINIKYQQGEFNLALAGTIAALLIAIGSFLYANEVSQRSAAQQSAIAQLQTTVTTQQEQINQATTELSDLQTNVTTQSARVETIEKEFNAMKEEARKRAEKAKVVAKPVAKHPAKAPAKHTTKPATKTAHKK